MTMKNSSRVFAMARPGALPMSTNRQVSALTKASVLDKWSDEAAGIRALEAGDNVITMFDMVGEDFWSGGGITAKKVASQLKAIGPRPVEIQMNSPGGDMFEGIAIYNVLREHPQDITIKIMGMAASAASIIAMAGDNIQIGAASFIMIHNCWVVSIGNRHDMQQTAEWLAPFDQAMVDVYSQRTGSDAKDVAKWMDAETFMSGTMAIDRGFADELLAADTMTTDTKAQASDRQVNEYRAMELALMAQGRSRAEARARVNKIRGTTDSALEAGTTDSAGAEDWSGFAGLLATFRT
jgi:ATP-dependent protease ClpP protease subunit